MSGTCTGCSSSSVGAGALGLAQARRAQTARTLLEQTPLSVTDVAFAAGFGSLRQFNDVMRAEYGASPTRAAPASDEAGPAGRRGIAGAAAARDRAVGRRRLLAFLGLAGDCGGGVV